MSTTAPSQGSASSTGEGRLVFRKNRWIEGWDPENTTQWEREGHKIANRNLGFSVYAEFLGFVVWQLWSIVVVTIGGKMVNGVATAGWSGFYFTSSEQFWLISLPSLVGATLRFPYAFMISIMGGRNWTIVSASLLLIPTTAMAFAINNHPVLTAACAAASTDPSCYTGGTSHAMMFFIAALGGFGGGNFASSMANINFFFPQRTKGWALGLNAAGGNIGAAVAQFTVPIAITLTAAKVVAPDGSVTRPVTNLPIAGWLWIPLIVLAICGAIFGMNNLTNAKSDSKGYVAALKDWHMWLMSFLYIGTFGSFIGLAGAFPKLIADQFPNYSTIKIGIVGVGLAFLGPLVGSLARPYGGRLADKFGGAYMTVGAFAVMIIATFSSIQVLTYGGGFWAFLVCFLVLFIATGMGNGSMYKMIPTVFAYLAGAKDARNESAGISTERKTSAALGIVAAFGAYGGFFIPQLFSLTQKAKNNVVVEGYKLGLWWLFGSYFVFLIVTIVFYVIPFARKGTRV